MSIKEQRDVEKERLFRGGFIQMDHSSEDREFLYTEVSYQLRVLFHEILE